jgi:hypothetical protein
MVEFLQELLVQACSAMLGFAAGTLWMRENYLKVIQMKDDYIQQLKMELSNKR